MVRRPENFLTFIRDGTHIVVQTDQTKDMDERIRQHQKDNVPLRRFARVSNACRGSVSDSAHSVCSFFSRRRLQVKSCSSSPSMLAI